MKVYQNLSEFQKIPCPVVTSGTFDGVHLGHYKIFERLNKVADKVGGESLIITYWPHPRLVLYPDESDLKLLTTLQEKISLLDKAGIQHLVMIPFTKDFSQLSSQEFIKGILVEKIGTKSLVIGHDHRFGKNREGSFKHLKNNAPKYGFTVEEIPKQELDDVAISSTTIRKALFNGDIKKGNDLLGRPYSISGTVIRGDQIGKQLGFPTANIMIEEPYKLIPGDGIYAVKVLLKNQAHEGMLYIGNRPTLNGKSRTIEVNLFNFDQDIYGEVITVLFYRQIRGDAKFATLEALKNQLAEDKIQTSNYFTSLTHEQF